MFKECATKFLLSFTNVKLWLFAGVLTPVSLFIEKYIFADWQFIKWLVLMMALDLITGIIKAVIKNETISSYGFRRTAMKGMQYSIFLIVMHILENYEIDNEKVGMFDWMTRGAYSFLIGIEGKSVLENIAVFDKRFDVSYFIEGMIKKFKKNSK